MNLQIWDEVPKRPAHRSTKLDQIFRVEVVALSSYEREEEKFKEEVAPIHGVLKSYIWAQSYFYLPSTYQN